MAKKRYVDDSFWTDPYIEKLSPDYKLVFLHLLTNPLCNIAGVFEIRLKRIAYETGYDIEVIENIFKRFDKDQKIIRFKDWIIIKNHCKHQSLGNLTANGINKIINESPEQIRSLFELKEFTNSNDEIYSVLVLKDNSKPLTSPLQAPTEAVYNSIEYNKIELINIKCIYGEFKNVYLSEEEYNKLIEKLGDRITNLLIEELSGYMASKKTKYINHYATLLNWARRKGQEQNNRINSRAKPFKVIE